MKVFLIEKYEDWRITQYDFLFFAGSRTSPNNFIEELLLASYRSYTVYSIYDNRFPSDSTGMRNWRTYLYILLWHLYTVSELPIWGNADWSLLYEFQTNSRFARGADSTHNHSARKVKSLFVTEDILRQHCRFLFHCVNIKQTIFISVFLYARQELWSIIVSWNWISFMSNESVIIFT